MGLAIPVIPGAQPEPGKTAQPTWHNVRSLHPTVRAPTTVLGFRESDGIGGQRLAVEDHPAEGQLAGSAVVSDFPSFQSATIVVARPQEVTTVTGARGPPTLTRDAATTAAGFVVNFALARASRQ
jgi:hypothetical protein